MDLRRSRLVASTRADSAISSTMCQPCAARRWSGSTLGNGSQWHRTGIAADHPWSGTASVARSCLRRSSAPASAAADSAAAASAAAASAAAASHSTQLSSHPPTCVSFPPGLAVKRSAANLADLTVSPCVSVAPRLSRKQTVRSSPISVPSGINRKLPPRGAHIVGGAHVAVARNVGGAHGLAPASLGGPGQWPREVAVARSGQGRPGSGRGRGKWRSPGRDDRPGSGRGRGERRERGRRRGRSAARARGRGERRESGGRRGASAGPGQRPREVAVARSAPGRARSGTGGAPGVVSRRRSGSRTRPR